MAYLPIVELTRGGVAESLHYGALAVADAQGRLVAAYGDPDQVAFLRSSAKPFQAIPLVESGAARAFGFTPAEVALACASHAGLDMHAETAAAMEAKSGVAEADLLCGVHEPGDEATARRLVREGRPATPNRHNCSGKHAGMLALARHQGLALTDYINPQHGVQQAILAAFAQMCGLAPAEVVVGIDGCSAPNFAVPLRNAAAAFARLADPARLPAARAAAVRAIFSAMTTHPEMVSAPGGFDTELMRARPGRLAAKGGAEGYQGVAIAPGALGPDSPALGLALKIADGASRAARAAALEALRQLGAVDQTHLDRLAGLGFGPRQPLKNYSGLVVGELRACFALADS